ncbi:MAG TPA: hypothetical protein VGP73_20330 [Thermoanaerobaculia bacterium]
MTQARQEGAGGKHPADEDLVNFMRGDLAPRKAAPIVRHLLAGCARCSAITRKLWSFGGRASGLGGRVLPFQPVSLAGVWS